ncbi:hypothetical protein NN561_005489 [Cricetulus griseus]
MCSSGPSKPGMGIKLLKMTTAEVVGADEDSDAAASGYEVRRQGGKVPGERRPLERGVPGTGQLGARAGRPHRPVGGSATTTSVPGVFDPSQPREGDVGRRRSSERLRAPGAARKLRGAQQPPAGGGHRDPWVPGLPSPPAPLRTALALAQGSALQRRRDLAGDPSRSKFRSRLRESVWTRLSRSAELTRLTGRLRCGCAGWECGGGQLGNLPASSEDTLQNSRRLRQTSPERLRESSLAGVCTPLPSPQSSARLDTPRGAGASELRTLRKEGHSRPASRGVGGRVSPLRSLPTLVRIRRFL